MWNRPLAISILPAVTLADWFCNSSTNAWGAFQRMFQFSIKQTLLVDLETISCFISVLLCQISTQKHQWGPEDHPHSEVDKSERGKEDILSVSGEAEQNAYMRVQQVSKDTDLLMWWKQQRQEFPCALRSRNDINLDMLIWLSESSLSGLFSEVSLIRDNQRRETVWLSKGLIIKPWKPWLSLIIKVFTTSLPIFQFSRRFTGPRT